MGKERIKIIEENLNLNLPTDYKNFIKNIGIISNELGEIYGLSEEIKNIEKLPCVIGATKLYKRNYAQINDKDIVITFDNFLNAPVVLNSIDEKIYRVDFKQRELIYNNFNEFLEGFYKKK